ncbi:glycosyltransferase family 2 protein [Methylobacterium pseudosasicola]|uniref:Glycosyl transferase family 2 n=1 Tax=Methylobacterium pseudosasicola TaxID=582667 RepID=A0A1I4HHI9_9HYPH|nr:glycosyltransferase family A protein [Methylobacterium pseudosasicola]SFL40856.1 Glycosyl transferase family 2 [Methylobacterium pseudosasicola]
MPSIDVVVPCYKYAHYLEGCVQSILSQRDVTVRVLIVDDASPDDTPAVARRLAAADPRVTYLRNAENLGLIATANRGVMDWARADYVVLISADDLLAPGSLARATQLMDNDPSIAMAYGMALMLADGRTAPTSTDPREADCQVISGRAFLHRICTAGNGVPTPCAVMRTSVQHRIGGYDPAFRHTSDLDTWMRAASVGSIGIINAVQGLYRWHASNMSAAYQLRPIGDRREILETCEAFEHRFGDRAPEFSTWLAEMRGRFAREALWIASAALDVPGDGTWRDCLAFAQAHDAGYWRSPTWWRITLKRLLGARRTASLKALRNPAGGEARPWYAHGARIGWWPEAGEIGT